MNSRETSPLQRDMFTGTLVDNRTAAQKQRAQEQAQPHQLGMFAQRDLAQFGVSAHPTMPLSPGRLVLICEDLRSEEEIEQARQRASQALTTPLFQSAVLPVTPQEEVETEEITESEGIPVCWVSRAALLKRRPDLRKQILALDEDELAYLAEKVEDALQESCWLILGIVLALYLDHQLQLRLNPKPHR